KFDCSSEVCSSGLCLLGVLWDEDRRFSDPLIAGFSAMEDLVVGDNEPYSGALEGDTLNVHGTRRGLAHALIEIRQDLIAHQSGVDEWIDRLARVLEAILNEPELHRAIRAGGRT